MCYRLNLKNGDIYIVKTSLKTNVDNITPGDTILPDTQSLVDELNFLSVPESEIVNAVTHVSAYQEYKIERGV